MAAESSRSADEIKEKDKDEIKDKDKNIKQNLQEEI